MRQTTQAKEIANERFRAAISERQRLRRRFRRLTSDRQPIPRSLWQKIYFAGLEVERLRGEVDHE